MSDYKVIEIIVNVIEKNDERADKPAKMVSGIIDITVSEIVTIDEVMEEIKKRTLSIEDEL